MTTLAEILSRRVSYTPTDPINVNNNISVGYRSNLDPRMGGTRSGLFPPSRSMIGGQGFSKSPFLEDVSNVSESIYNEALVPTYNTISQKIDPIFMSLKSYFGGDSSPVMGTIKEKDINLTNKKTTTDIPQTLTEQIQADINKAQENKDDTPDVSLQSQANQEGLLSNSEVKEQNNKGILSFTSQPAKEGSYTYSQPVSSNSLLNQNQTDSKSVVTNQQTNTEVNAVNNAPVVADPSVEAVATTNNEVTPTKTFMDKLTNFATSEFGQDFFASLLAGSGPTVGKPQSFGSNLGKAYEKARELQAERDEKAKGSGDRSFAYMMQVTDGPQAGKAYPVVMDEKGNFEAVIDNKKVPVTNDLFNGAYRISTTGNLGAGSVTSSDFTELTKLVNEEGINIRKLEDFILDVNQMDSGPLNKFMNQMNFYVKNILDSNDLTDKELLQEIASGRFQQLVGANRLNVLGPGVLTEQDAQRLIEALGGDPSNFFNNKQKSLAILSDILKNKYDLYETNYNFYEDQTKIGNFATRDPVEKYQLSDPVMKLMDRVNVGFIDYRTLKPEDIRTLSFEQLNGLDLGLLSDAHLEVVDEMLARYNDQN
tara:strand:+ start:1256 stop:3037 length:1782 start_codon:yes stop_codon:yes gene_type:complete